jgi:hypothetical protein
MRPFSQLLREQGTEARTFKSEFRSAVWSAGSDSVPPSNAAHEKYDAGTLKAHGG